jgi:protease-4
VILRVNSPGGDAVASDEILREVKLLSGKKPMIISMSDLAASGGYFISMTGDPVLAYPNTITGSIGVIFGKVNLTGLYSKIGVGKEILTRGRFAAIDSDAVPLDEAGRKKLREGVDSIYQAFLARVAEGRKKKPAEIEPLAEGRAWLGSQAKGNGLVDELGGLDRAIAMVRERAKIPASERVRLVVYPRKKSIFEQLLGGTQQALAGARPGDLVGEAARLAGIDAGSLRLWLPGGYLKVAPYTIRVD